MTKNTRVVLESCPCQRQRLSIRPVQSAKPICYHTEHDNNNSTLCGRSFRCWHSSYSLPFRLTRYLNSYPPQCSPCQTPAPARAHIYARAPVLPNPPPCAQRSGRATLIMSDSLPSQACATKLSRRRCPPHLGRRLRLRIARLPRHHRESRAAVDARARERRHRTRSG